MKIAYIAHKVGDDVKGNVDKILALVRDINLTEPNTIPFAPYISDVMALNDEAPSERERGFKNNKHYFQKGIVDELRLYGPKVSAGMIEEIKWARLYGIPIVNNLSESKEDATHLIENRNEYLSKILHSVLTTFDISENDLKSKSRKRCIVMARQIFIGLCFEIIPFEVTTISLGKMLLRDHSTIIYNRDTFADLRDTNKVFVDFYTRVKILVNYP